MELYFSRSILVMEHLYFSKHVTAVTRPCVRSPVATNIIRGLQENGELQVKQTMLVIDDYACLIGKDERMDEIHGY